MAIAPSARALVTLDEYKVWPRPEVPASSQDNTLNDHWQALINSAGDMLKNRCDLPLIHEDATEYYDVPGQALQDVPLNRFYDGDGDFPQDIWLTRYPVIIGAGSVLTVTEDQGGGPVTLTKDSEFKLNLKTGQMFRYRGGARWRWHPGDQNVVVLYRAGRWANTAAVDWDMKQAAVLLVDWLHALGPGSYGVNFGPAGGFRPDAFPKQIDDMLKRFKRGQW